MDDPRVSYFASIDLATSRIARLPGIVFVCGGPKEHIGQPPTSVRDHIVRSLTDFPSFKSISTELIEAEEAQDWLLEGQYLNLISLETDIAELASLIVLFVESPGSIAELGAFSVIDQIASKLIVFMRENSYSQNSFIKLGPIKHLEAMKSPVKVYPWALLRQGTANEFGAVDMKSVESLTTDICSDICSVFSHIPKRPKFNKNLPSHIMLLICDLVDISLALKQKEILEYLHSFGIKISESNLKKYLYLLVKFNLLIKMSYGDHFYITNSSAFVTFKFKNPKPSDDRLSLKASMSIYYQENDKSRHNALKKRIETYGGPK